MAKEDFYQEIDDEITFNIMNQDVLERLKRNGEIKVPKKLLDIPKDKRWNKKQMASKVLQGLMSGSSVLDIAEAMKAVIGNNEVSAIRNTRTMTTSAENNGRLDSYKNLANQGVVMKKEWIATPDDRTRPTHLALDGEQIDLDKTFSNGCRFPGDAKGPAEEVWMCRCAMGTHIIGFRRADGSISKVDYQRDDTLHDKQMELEKKQRKQKQKAKSVSPVVNGKDISATWQRRSDEFDFEIDDVINAQGFDGLPRVVNAEEFDKYVEESNFIAQRTYSAPDQETLDAYRDQLYNGKWYVDCSVGHSSFGQGMYCTPEFATAMSERALQEQKIYGELSRGRIEQNAENQYLFSHYKSTLDKVIKENNITDSTIIDILEAYDPVQGRYHDNEWYVTKNVDWVKEIASSNPEKYRTAKEIISKNEDVLEKAYRIATKESKSYEKIKAKSNTETFTLISNAKIADYSKLVEEMAGTEYTDIGVFAAAKGYDAVNIDILDGTIEAKQAIILNRTKCIFKGE